MNVKTQSRTQMAIDTIQKRIDGRLLEPGERLPSIRSLAVSLGVSTSTVVDAYDRLAAEGKIVSKPGSGFYVSTGIQPFFLADTTPDLDREIDPFWVSRQSLDASDEVLKPGCGWMPADWMPDEALRRAIRGLARSDIQTLTEYGSTSGSKNLRALLTRQFLLEGFDIHPEQILLTGSGTQAIDLICRFLLRPGDVVLIDDPCYFNFQALLRAHQVKIVSVPYTSSGPDPDSFAEALSFYNPKLYITNSALHNPTGATLAPQAGHRILNHAATHNLVIVEDDIFAAFEPEPSVRLASLDGLERVIRIGSYSKTLSASIRCGYIVARSDWVEQLTDLQVATNFGGPSPFAAELVHATLGDGSFRKHMEQVRRRLTKQRRKVADRLSNLGIEPWTNPRGGFYLWCRLPEHCDSADLASYALQENTVLAPGNVFSASLSMGNFMRFNVSQMKNAQIYDVLEQGIKYLSGTR